MAAILVMVVGVLIAAAVTLVMVLNPTPTPQATFPTQDPERSESSVRQAAQLALDTYSSGSYGDFWDLWSSQGQALIKQEDYVRLFQLCPPLVQDGQFTISSVVIEGDNATVQATGPGDQTEFGFVLEGGQWRYTPPVQQETEYRTKTVDQLAQERRAAGTCGTGPSGDPSYDPSPGPSPEPSTGPDPSVDPSSVPTSFLMQG
ncbi:hypothetical protein [Streptosporangium saharense]|uniref:Uncharacterized protein n=1 Tax=Streptosporangium saharense TaxID=1706840 RepID=A0A7W7QV12_9ACTN|nr:hypothetical protein [Streptosporangium saharense]MBB4920298.1 hypothetical protein [Streptosporangium saharense]